MKQNDNLILEVKNLRTYFYLDEGILKAVDGVDFFIKEGKTLGVVGESGCGKSVTAQAILRIVPNPGKVDGEIILHKRRHSKDNSQGSIDLVKLPQYGPEMRSIRGGEIAMIFQEPMKAFSPIHTIGNQIMEGILLHTTECQRPCQKYPRSLFQSTPPGHHSWPLEPLSTFWQDRQSLSSSVRHERFGLWITHQG